MLYSFPINGPKIVFGGSWRPQGHLTKSPLYILMLAILLCCCVSTAALAFDHLQSAFCTIQSHLFHLSLVLNGDKTKVMFFSNKKKEAACPCIVSQACPACPHWDRGHLQIFSHRCQSHIDHLLKNLKVKLASFFSGANPVSLLMLGNGLLFPLSLLSWTDDHKSLSTLSSSVWRCPSRNYEIHNHLCFQVNWSWLCTCSTCRMYL